MANEHYTQNNGQQLYDFIAEYTQPLKGETAFYMGNVVKYLCRYNRKGQAQSDLAKALDYMQQLDNVLQSQRRPQAPYIPSKLEITDFTTTNTLTEQNVLTLTLQALHIYAFKSSLNYALLIEKNIKKLQKMVDK